VVAFVLTRMRLQMPVVGRDGSNATLTKEIQRTNRTSNAQRWLRKHRSAKALGVSHVMVAIMARLGKRRVQHMLPTEKATETWCKGRAKQTCKTRCHSTRKSLTAGRPPLAFACAASKRPVGAKPPKKAGQLSAWMAAKEVVENKNA